jgi:hypothetical protein
MNRSRQAATSARSGTRSRPSTARSTLKRDIRGVELHPDPDPRSFNLRPWNSLVVNWTFSEAPNPFSITGVEIRNQVAQQLTGSTQTTGPGLEFRVRTIRAFSSASSSDTNDSPIFIVVYPVQPLTTGQLPPLHLFQDSPGKNHRAATGFLWPASHQNEVVSGTSTRILATVDGNATVIRMEILWRLTAAIPALTSLGSTESRPQVSLEN